MPCDQRHKWHEKRGTVIHWVTASLAGHQDGVRAPHVHVFSLIGSGAHNFDYECRSYGIAQG